MIKILLVSFFLSFICSYSFAQQTIFQDILITLERDPGFWGRAGSSSCPFYKLTISADGTVELQLKEYKEQKIIVGTIIKSKISQEQVKQLVSEFEKIDFYSLKSTFDSPMNNQEDCPQIIPDHMRAVTSLTLKEKTKRVEHYYGCEGTESLYNLTNLEKKIDETVNIKQWIDCYTGKNGINLPAQTNQ